MKDNNKKILKELIKISYPIMIVNIIQSLYILIDLFFLGKLSKEALIAPGMTFSVFYFFVVFGIGFSSAGATMLSQAFGDNENKKKIGYLTSQIFFLNLLLGIIFSLLSFFLARIVLNLINIPSGIIYEYTYSYYRIIASGLFLSFITMTFSSVFRAIGNTKLPLLIQVISVSINLILDPIFIFTLDMGVVGAAWATNIAKLISATVSIIILLKNKSIVRIRIKEMKITKKVFKMQLNIGFYSSLGYAISALGLTTVQGIINGFGPDTIAALSICNRINSFFTVPTIAMGQAVSVLVGKYLGANREDKAVTSVNMGMLFCSLTTGIAMIYLFFRGHTFIKIFSTQQNVIEIGMQFFHYVTFSVFLFGLFTVFSGAFTGGGVTKPILVFAIIRLWGIRVPLAYLLPTVFNLGLTGFWYALISSNLIVSIIAFILYYKGIWKNKLNIKEL